MTRTKRILVASLFGLLFGLVCFALASSSAPLPRPVALQIITSRTLIGVAIGISSWTLYHWAIHGLAMGFLFSVPLALGGLMAPATQKFSGTMMFVATIVMGMIYGVLIEFMTSVVFKSRMASRTATSPSA